MKKILFLFLLLPGVLLAQNSGYKITGKVAGVANGTEVKLVRPADNTVIASTIVKDGIFKLDGALTEPDLVSLSIGKEAAQPIFLDNSNITINGSIADAKNIKIEGGKTNNDFEQYRKTFSPLIEKLNGVAAKFEKAMRMMHKKCS